MTQDDIKEYLRLMPDDLKQRYEFLKYRFKDNWKDHYYKKSLNWLEQNESVINPQPLINYNGVEKQQEAIKQMAQEQNARFKNFNDNNK